MAKFTGAAFVPLGCPTRTWSAIRSRMPLSSGSWWEPPSRLLTWSLAPQEPARQSLWWRPSIRFRNSFSLFFLCSDSHSHKNTIHTTHCYITTMLYTYTRMYSVIIFLLYGDLYSKLKSIKQDDLQNVTMQITHDIKPSVTPPTRDCGGDHVFV